MVMVTRSGRRRACYDSSDASTYDVPPWCSLGKFTKKTKPSELSLDDWEKSCRSLQNEWEISTKDKGVQHSSRFRSKNCRNKSSRVRVNREKHSAKFPNVFASLLLLIASLIALELTGFWSTDSEIQEGASTSVSNLDFSVTSGHASPAVVECCSRLQQVSAALWRAEQILRKTRSQKTLMLSQRKYFHEKLQVGSYYKTVDKLSYISEAPIPVVSASLGTNTVEWSGRTALWGVVPLWRAAPPPTTVLAARPVLPGDCWPFSGSSGEVIIEFGSSVRPHRLSLEHIRPDSARSAPKHFQLSAILENGTRITTLTDEYDYFGPAKQYFVIANSPTLKQIAFTVLTNHGNIKYTCIYRLGFYGNEV